MATLIAAGSVSPAAKAQSSGKATCITAFEEGARLRSERKLLSARQRLLECGGTQCPADVQKECAKELELVNQSLPTMVVTSRDQLGRDLVEGKVLVDGESHPLDGRAVAFDPGRHTVRVEVAGCEAAEQRVLLAEGEVNRAVVATLHCEESGASASSGATVGPSPSAPASRSLVLPLVFGGVGVVGLAGFAAFGIVGRNEIDDIRATGCAPACNRSEVMSARAKLLVADVSGIVGVLGLGAAAYFAFLAPSAHRPVPPASQAISTTVDFAPAPAGGTMTFKTRF